MKISMQPPTQWDRDIGTEGQPWADSDSNICTVKKISPAEEVDFNARSPHLWKDEQKQSPKGKGMADFCIRNFLQQIIEEPTHIPNDTTQTCIDLILTNQVNFV